MVKKKNTEKFKSWLIIGIALVTILVLLLMYSGTVRVGQAISIGNTPWAGGTIDLTVEESFSFTSLPQEERSIPFSAGITPFDAQPQEYEFGIVELDDFTFSFIITKANRNIASDVIYVGGEEDVTRIYLDDNDAIPDLEVAFRDNQIVITSLHYTSADDSLIELLNAAADAYSSLIRLDPGEEFVARISASSSSAPLLEVNIGVLSGLESDFDQGLSAGIFTYTAPQNPSYVILDITGDVQGRITHKYYTLFSGDVIYELDEVGFPHLTISLDENDLASYEFTLEPTEQLQALSLACEFDERSISRLFADTKVNRVYSFDSQAEKGLVWSSPTAPNEIDRLSLFEGYFLSLREPAPTTIEDGCSLQLIESLSEGQLLGGSSIVLRSGWNLFSLPGIVPRPLTDFTRSVDFEIHECSQNYDCNQIAIDDTLFPGKPYWIRTNQPITIRYSLE